MVEKNFVRNGESIAQKAIDENGGEIAQEFLEFEKKRVEQEMSNRQKQIERLKEKGENTQSIKDSLNKLQRKINRINELNDQEYSVPRIVVKDRYFNEGFAKANQDEELYPYNKIDIFDSLFM